MITISDSVIDSNTIIDKFPQGSVERKIIGILSSSSERYNYASQKELEFQLTLQKNIVNAAVGLYRSRISFRIFRKSRCNPDYWERTDEGGFKLKEGVKPSDAIKDIFAHGSRYGTECSTAMVIIYYKALLDTFSDDFFNKLFPEIYLMNWTHLDNNLGLVIYEKVKDYLPGDGRYFKNPDVDPLTPQWQGENVIDLGDGSYYGHGIGIGSSSDIIKALNSHTTGDSPKPAYLMDSVKRLDYRTLMGKYNKFLQESGTAPTAS